MSKKAKRANEQEQEVKKEQGARELWIKEGNEQKRKQEQIQ